MARMTGKYTTVSGAPLDPALQPRIRAVPVWPAVTVDGKALSMDPEVVTPAADGSFFFDLEPTANVHQRGFHYLITGSYLEPLGYGLTGYTQHDTFAQKLYVPDEGGSIGDFAVPTAATGGLVWVGSTPPPTSMQWLYLAPFYTPDTEQAVPVYTAPDGTTIEHGELVEWSA